MVCTSYVAHAFKKDICRECGMNKAAHVTTTTAANASTTPTSTATSGTTTATPNNQCPGFKPHLWKTGVCAVCQQAEQQCTGRDTRTGTGSTGTSNITSPMIPGIKSTSSGSSSSGGSSSSSSNRSSSSSSSSSSCSSSPPISSSTGSSSGSSSSSSSISSSSSSSSTHSNSSSSSSSSPGPSSSSSVSPPSSACSSFVSNAFFPYKCRSCNQLKTAHIITVNTDTTATATTATTATAGAATAAAIPTPAPTAAPAIPVPESSASVSSSSSVSPHAVLSPSAGSAIQRLRASLGQSFNPLLINSSSPRNQTNTDTTTNSNKQQQTPSSRTHTDTETEKETQQQQPDKSNGSVSIVPPSMVKKPAVGHTRRHPSLVHLPHFTPVNPTATGDTEQHIGTQIAAAATPAAENGSQQASLPPVSVSSEEVSSASDPLRSYNKPSSTPKNKSEESQADSTTEPASVPGALVSAAVSADPLLLSTSDDLFTDDTFNEEELKKHEDSMEQRTFTQSETVHPDSQEERGEDKLSVPSVSDKDKVSPNPVLSTPPVAQVKSSHPQGPSPVFFRLNSLGYDQKLVDAIHTHSSPTAAAAAAKAKADGGKEETRERHPTGA